MLCDTWHKTVDMNDTLPVISADEEMIDCNLGGTIAPSNGTVDCTKKNSPGSLCTYRCQDGYSLDGPAKTTCMNAGTWSPNNFPRCISKSFQKPNDPSHISYTI